MLCELTRLIDNAEVERQDRTVEQDPHLTNSQSGIYNNTINMINSQVVHGLSVNLSRVGEANTSGIDEERTPYFTEENNEKPFNFYKQALLGIKTSWENQKVGSRVDNNSLLNDTLEKELEAGERKDTNMNASNDFLLLVNEEQESRDETSKILEPGENCEAFGKEDIRNISIIKQR